MDREPDYELDAYLRSADERDFLCDVKVWLPSDPRLDGCMQVVAMGVDADRVHPKGLVSLFSDKEVEAAGLRFEARDILVRRSTSRGPRKAGGAKLTITHVGSLRIEAGRRAQEETDSPQMPLQWLQFVLSELSYGHPQHIFTVDFRGTRSVHSGKAKVLRMVQGVGAACEFELEQHWTWLNDGDARISATCAPVLNLLSTPKHSETALADLTSVADDACVLLSLAARHRVVVHTVVSGLDTSVAREWRNPLARIRARTEEDACGPLIDVAAVEGYFSHTSAFWSELDTGERDAIRLAVFTVHPSTDRTLEGGFLAMFSALEGLAKKWGKATGKLREKMGVLLERYPVRIGGLWPLFDTEAGAGLYWIRNELAHGGGRLVPGALVLAHDHLQLWLEHVLLAVMGYEHRLHAGDWLRGQVVEQRAQVAELQMALHDSGRRSKSV